MHKQRFRTVNAQRENIIPRRHAEMIAEELAKMGSGQSAQSGEGGDVVRLIENLPDALDGGQQTTLADGDSEIL